MNPDTDNFDLEELKLPPRSILYNLEPMGLGTPYVESLTSYISRLAECHNLNVTTLVCNTFIPFVNLVHLERSLMDKSLGALVKYINGNSPVSLEYVSALEKLTTRSDLIYLTMNLWSGLFSNNATGALRKWCPVCLEELKNKRDEIYEPLIWSIKDIEICDRHKIKLEDRCPNCGRELQFLHTNILVGHCQYCLSWLGNNSEKTSINPSDYQLFLIDSFKSLIANAHKVEAFPTNIGVGMVLKEIMEDNHFSSITQFAKYLGVHRAALTEWINYNRKPTMESMFKICQKLNLSIYEIFYIKPLIIKDLEIINELSRRLTLKEIEEVLKNAIGNNSYISLYELSLQKGFDIHTAKKHFSDLCEEVTNKNSRYKRDLQKQKKKNIKEKITMALEKDPPISLKQFSLEFNISINDVKKYYPDLAKKLIDTHISYRKEQKNYRSEKIKNEIREVILELHQSGIYPSDKAMRKKLSKPYYLVDPEFREAWKKELEILGYKDDLV